MKYTKWLIALMIFAIPVELLAYNETGGGRKRSTSTWKTKYHPGYDG